MSNLTEAEILSKHKDALGIASKACQRLGKNADPLHLALRKPDYDALQAALKELEGSARQMSQFRSDGRWIRLGFVYAQAMRLAQRRFNQQRWAEFTKMTELFTLGQRRLTELDVRTGTIGPILPKRASEWIILPDEAPFNPREFMQ